MSRWQHLTVVLLSVVLALVSWPSSEATAAPAPARTVAAVPADTVPDFANEARRVPLPGGQWTACVGGACPRYPASSISVSNTTSCVVTHGAVWCWNTSQYWQVRVPGKARQVFTGEQHACATVGKARKLWCWGSNYRGELGNGGTTPASSLTPVFTGLKGITTAHAGRYATCAANSAGTAWCWGWYFGPNWGDRKTPQKMALPPVTAFTASVSPSICARTPDGLYCTSTGDSENSNLGSQSTATFTRKMDPVDAASLNRYFGCVVQAGAVSCWRNADPPAPVGLTGVSDIATTESQVCVTAGRALECRDTTGQQLLRTNSTHSFTVVRSGWQTLVLAADGDIWRWTPGYGIHQLTFLPKGR